MIQFQQVSKRYKGNEFEISNLNFTVEPGEFVFLIGPSGSGKTTVIRLLIREELPSEGRIYFDDYDITRLSRNSVYQLRRQIGVVFQDYKLIPDKTVYENVAFAMEVAGRAEADIAETVPYLLDIVGLSQRADAFPSHLSGGEKQRVAIARAVSNNPRVLVADEPTGNLDPGAAWDIVQILSKINNWGTTVIMSTHGTDIVNTLNKRVIQMEDGRVVRDDSKGFYEITTFEDSVIDQQTGESVENPVLKLENDEEIPAEAPVSAKGQIHVNFKRNQPHEVTRRTAVKSSVPAPEAEVDTVEDIDPQTQQLLEIAAETAITALDVPAEVQADLQSAGYKTVQDVLVAGPDKLAQELIIDADEVQIVSKALSNFLNAHDVQAVLETSVAKAKAPERAPKPKQTKPASKPKSKKVKIDLAGSKKSS